MKRDIFCVVPVVYRPRETEATLRTLALTEGIERMHVVIQFLARPELTGYHICGMLNDINCSSYVLQELSDRDIPLSPKPGWAAMFTLALNELANTDYPWYCRLENDNIFNPSWLSDLFRLHDQATSDGLKVGLMCPTRRRVRGYRYTDPGPDRDYIIARRLSAAAWFVSREAALCDRFNAALAVQLRGAPDWRYAEVLHERGYTHICPKISSVQNIGKTGITTQAKKWTSQGSGGLGFVPDSSILEIWKEFNA